jgi:hypothetical protein
VINHLPDKSRNRKLEFCHGTLTECALRVHGDLFRSQIQFVEAVRWITYGMGCFQYLSWRRLRDYYEAVTALCSTYSRNPRLALLSQTPSLPLAAMVSAIFFMPKSSKVFLVGQPWAVSQPSNL